MLDLQTIRDEIDVIDSQIVALLEKRIGLTGQVAAYKMQSGKPVLDEAREKEKLRSVTALTHSDENAKDVAELFQHIMSLSRDRQHKLLGTSPEALQETVDHE